MTAEAENLAGQQPVEQADRVLAAVVGGDGHINVAEGRIGIAESNDGDVAVSSLQDGLVIHAWVGDDQQAWLNEALLFSGETSCVSECVTCVNGRQRVCGSLNLDLVGEGTGGEATSQALSASVVSELEDGALTISTSGNGAHVSGVLIMSIP